MRLGGSWWLDSISWTTILSPEHVIGCITEIWGNPAEFRKQGSVPVSYQCAPNFSWDMKSWIWWIVVDGYMYVLLLTFWGSSSDGDDKTPACCEI